MLGYRSNIIGCFSYDDRDIFYREILPGKHDTLSRGKKDDFLPALRSVQGEINLVEQIFDVVCIPWETANDIAETLVFPLVKLFGRCKFDFKVFKIFQAFSSIPDTATRIN
jgi:hypothetical protein